MKAFPKPSLEVNVSGEVKGWQQGNEGMELRDYFAAKAMATLLMIEPEKWHLMYQDKYPTMLTGVATVAYNMADKMIEVRGKSA